jgi:hypothetical protein
MHELYNALGYKGNSNQNNTKIQSHPKAEWLSSQKHNNNQCWRVIGQKEPYTLSLRM